MLDEREVRLRCIEAASKAPMVHVEGPAEGVRETAEKWANWILGSNGPKPGTLSLPKKGA